MEGKTILVTGASGNIGYELVTALFKLETKHTIIAADYQPEKAKTILAEFRGLQVRKLDFADPSDFDSALENIDIVFLLRPPNLADIPKYFQPFIEAMQRNNISDIAFLSVQGVENQKFIPHHKLEKLITDVGLNYIFLRPAYFMQNLTTTLIHEIKAQDKIFIPSGKLKFNWVDARDIGRVGGAMLIDFERYANQAYEITGSEFIGFKEVAQLMSDQVGRKIKYESPNLMKFFRAKRKLGIPKAMIFVMIMLHYLPRFSKNKERLTQTVEEITKSKPGTLKAFIEREAAKFAV